MLFFQYKWAARRNVKILHTNELTVILIFAVDLVMSQAVETSNQNRKDFLQPRRQLQTTRG